VKYILALSLALLLAGCAKSPQQVTFDAQVSEGSVWVGKGKRAELQVVDARSSTNIGSRGGIYQSTSTLSLDNRATEDMSIYLQTRLLTAGFKLSNTEPFSKWTVKLTDLTYDYKKVKGMRDQVEITSGISVEIVSGLSTYTNEYSASSVNELVTLASDAQNQEWINTTLNAALDQLFADAGINDFLK
jgi:uncharacterized lipoprotein